VDLTLQRTDLQPTRTFGHLTGPGVSLLTLEDQVRPTDAPKVPGATAIPAGRYRLVVTWSPRFGQRLPLLLDVPGFEGIRIHAGNTEADTAGCILVGMDRLPDRVVQSRPALDLLLDRLEARGDETHWLTIEETRTWDIGVPS